MVTFFETYSDFLGLMFKTVLKNVFMKMHTRQDARSFYFHNLD
jgi:hypothetical protein